MFAGLVLTSISTVMLRAALFQRKSRSGWLEELDGIREDALDQHEAGADVVDAEGIWTDLRDGGEYEDPHEISSLYATDATPDLPVTKPVGKQGGSTAAKGRSRARASSSSEVAANAPPSSPPPPPAPPVVVELATEVVTRATDDLWTVEAGSSTPTQYDDQIWVQPAPHPIRPSEMWHPAELAPAPLGEESFEVLAEERVASRDLDAPSYDSTYDPTYATAIDEHTEFELESELVAAADLAVVDDSMPAGGLVNGPVARRVRRDRPVERPRASLPPTIQEPLADRGEQSPLPTQPLPPAALPTRSNRLPELDSLPVTPSSVLVPRSIAPLAPTPTEAALPDGDDPVAPGSEAVAPSAPIAIGEDGLIDAPGTIVRIGGARLARASGDPSGVVVGLDEGWCWASPGEGAAATLRIELPTGSLTIDPGATALAVVEADGSAFIIVAAGSAHVDQGGASTPVGRGSIVMIDPSGVAQTDAATDGEIEADPIVAENLALDAEL